MYLGYVTKIAPNKYQNFSPTKSITNLLEEIPLNLNLK